VKKKSRGSNVTERTAQFVPFFLLLAMPRFIVACIRAASAGAPRVPARARTWARLAGVLAVAIVAPLAGSSEADAAAAEAGGCSWDVLAQLRGSADGRAAAAVRRLLQDGQRCPEHAAAHEAWARYREGHQPVAARIRRSAQLGPRDALLVCQPFFGLGNRLNALAACAFTALATNRTLIVDWDGQEGNPDAAGASAPGGRLGDLFPDDVFWQWPRRVLSEVLSRAAYDNSLVEVSCERLRAHVSRIASAFAIAHSALAHSAARAVRLRRLPADVLADPPHTNPHNHLKGEADRHFRNAHA